MTKGEIIDKLELYTVGRPKKNQVSITVEELQNLIDGIKLLEQQPCECEIQKQKSLAFLDGCIAGISANNKIACDDCVSRQAVLDEAYAYGYGLEPEGYCVDVEDILALPPVTPTHGTCEGCKYNKRKGLGFCEKGNFLKEPEENCCRDFERQGNRNE